MVKALISLTDRQMDVLKNEAKLIGISKSELVRRIMDRYLGTGKKVTKKDPPSRD